MTPKVIKIIGVGGITNQMLSFLSQEFPETELILIDNDIYEPGNMARQPYAKFFGNKAIVTAKALMEEGLFKKVSAIPAYVEPENIEGLIIEGDVLFLAVDNHPTRKLIDDHCLRLNNILLVSGGNELYDGNVQIHYRRDGVGLTPPLQYCHPEIQFPKDKAPYQLDCGEIAASEPQIVETNKAVGLMMIEAYKAISVGDLIAEIYVDLNPETLKVRTRKVKSEERGWRDGKGNDNRQDRKSIWNRVFAR